VAALPEETLDPPDWAETARVLHLAVDQAVAHLREVRDRPAWQEMPAEFRKRFDEPLPQASLPLAEVLQDVSEGIMPFPLGNVHPRFWAWFMGAGNITGALADFLAAVMGSNLAGGNHAAALVDQQVVRWCKEIVGFPAIASGTLTSGGSVANLIALTVARNASAGEDLGVWGVESMARPLRFYGSDQLHSCHRKAIEILGLGHRALRLIPSDENFRLDLPALRTAIAEDRAAGVQPACLIANAGSVNTGAIDDLSALAAIAEEEGLWLHVDGCIGALIALAPLNRSLVAGLERAHSLALDPHKWLHAPFDVGCCLIRDAASHHAALASLPEYLNQAPRGVASADWLFELDLQMSRSFRALKVWMALKEQGAAKFGRLIDQNIEQARYLAQLVDNRPPLRLMARVTINIVCFRYEAEGLDEAALSSLNREIMLQLQEEGLAILSDTSLRGRHSLRVAICNHRTRFQDIDFLVEEVLRRGERLSDSLESGKRTHR
jgi:aromatic-L-amino-acid decarboxylase